MALKSNSSMTALSKQYAAQFSACAIKKEHAAEVRAEAGRILASRKVYEVVALHFSGMPWWVVGILHSMECGLNFTKHLHNGDPLKARTVQEPKGRPKAGNPPFTWLDSALDALKYDGFDRVTDWSIGGALEKFEDYNGHGYRTRGVPSPYLWSFTDQYRCGKYTADGHYSATAVSEQCGAAALLKALQTMKALD